MLLHCGARRPVFFHSTGAQRERREGAEGRPEAAGPDHQEGAGLPAGEETQDREEEQLLIIAFAVSSACFILSPTFHKATEKASPEVPARPLDTARL